MHKIEQSHKFIEREEREEIQTELHKLIKCTHQRSVWVLLDTKLFRTQARKHEHVHTYIHQNVSLV